MVSFEVHVEVNGEQEHAHRVTFTSEDALTPQLLQNAMRRLEEALEYRRAKKAARS